MHVIFLTLHCFFAKLSLMDIQSKASRNVYERLAFKTATKDQAGIAVDLASGKDVPEVYGLS